MECVETVNVGDGRAIEGKGRAMPNNIRAALTVVVVLVACGAFWFEHDAGEVFLKWLAAGLGAFMVIAVWLFPETQRKTDDPD